MRLFCIRDARGGSVWMSWSMLPSVLNRKCGSICACSASMRASSTVRSSCSVSARWVACVAVSSARRLPPATILVMMETTKSKKNGCSSFSTPARIKPRSETSSSVFHDTTASQSKKRHHSTTIALPMSRKVCLVSPGCEAGWVLPGWSILIGMPSARRVVGGKISGDDSQAPARHDTMRAGRDGMPNTVTAGMARRQLHYCKS